MRPDLRRRRVLITGGAGFIGSHLVRALLDRGDEVVAVDNLITGRKENLPSHARFTFVEADVSEGLPVTGRFDAVLHFACPASPVDFERIPLEIMRVDSLGTFHALERAKTDDARFILASTSEVYGDPLVHPQPESYWGNVNPTGLRSVYDEAKRFSEAAAFAYQRTHGVNVGVIRIFNTYGPHMRADDGRVVPTLVTQALRGEPLTVTGDGTQTRSLCFIDDLVRGVLLLLDSDESGPVNCGTTDEVTMTELAETVARLVGGEQSVTYIPRPQDDPSLRRPDLSRIGERLGFEPLITLEQGLQATIEYFRSDI